MPYTTLSAALDIPTTSDLESLLTHGCIYEGLLEAKLDARGACVRVSSAAARDVRDGDVGAVAARLEAWCVLGC